MYIFFMVFMFLFIVKNLHLSFNLERKILSDLLILMFQTLISRVYHLGRMGKFCNGKYCVIGKIQYSFNDNTY